MSVIISTVIGILLGLLTRYVVATGITNLGKSKEAASMLGAASFILVAVISTGLFQIIALLCITNS